MSSEAYRQALLKVLNEAYVTHNISQDKIEGIISHITVNDHLTFTNEEIPPEGANHNKPLHISVAFGRLWKGPSVPTNCCRKPPLKVIMGWEENVLRYIHNNGWAFLMSFHPKIYPQATTEFLATSSCVEIHTMEIHTIEDMPSSWMVSYWINDVYRFTTLDDFNVQCGFISLEDIYTARQTQLHLGGGYVEGDHR
ncbi:hypothetical protein Fmac_026606 [Flemingia macrophylla]|uniref:Uncharacterized protein n=1 Tax=Flemingia macrophylla TaxID=520843 RepID=A0ABD1LFA9_9FABA